MKAATKTYTPIVMDDDGFATIDGFDELPAVRPAKAESGTELATLPTNLAEAFAPGGLTIFIEAIREKANEFEADISTPTGRRELKSFCYKITRSKTHVDDTRKQYVSDRKNELKTIDAEGRRAFDELEAIAKEKLKPLTDWENKDKVRVAGHEAAIAELTAIGDQRRAGATSEQLATLLDSLQTFRERAWEEFDLRASKVIGNVEFYLKESHAAALVAESEKAELAKFRAAEVERKRREHEEAIAKEAAQRATQEAEERANAERRIVEARERRAVEDAQREKHAAEARILAAETAKRAADKRAKEAVENERLRVAKEAKAKADADAKRAADKQHKMGVEQKAINALISYAEIHESDAHSVIAEIVKGKIPGVSIAY